MADGAVAAADGRYERGEGARRRALRARPNRLTSPVSASSTSAVKGAHARQLGEDLDERVAPGVLAHLPVGPVDEELQGVDGRQVVVDHLAGDRRQFQARQPAAAWPLQQPAGRS